jgi:hypothetical protein
LSKKNKEAALRSTQSETQNAISCLIILVNQEVLGFEKRKGVEAEALEIRTSKHQLI